jgi:hypothetical protein
MSPPRDTPEQIDELHAAGYRRSLEIDGVGMWTPPGRVDEIYGAGAALAHLNARKASL